MSDIYNPWREFIENCMNGSNYFRSSEYVELLADLDRGYAAEAEIERLRSRLADKEIQMAQAVEYGDDYKRERDLLMVNYQTALAALAEADALLQNTRPFVYGLDRIKAIDAHLSRSVTAPE